MKSIVTIERTSCDFCDQESHEWTKCAWCGADCCYDHGTQHRRQLYFNSSADPRACPKCEAKIKNDPTLAGPLVEIERLRAELDRWRKDFEARYKAAEERAKEWCPLAESRDG